MTISEIRASAKTKLYGTHLKCSISCLLYFLINLLFTYFLKFLSLNFSSLNIGIIIIQLIFAIISIPFSYGIISNIIKLNDQNTNSVTKFLDEFIINFIKYLKLIFLEILRLIIPIILLLFATFYLIGTCTAYVNSKNFLCFFANLLPLAIIIFIATVIILIYFLLNYSIVAYLYYNSEEKNEPKKLLNKSKELMNGHKLDFIKLLLSFVPYLIFVGIILFILGNFIPEEYLTPLSIVLYTFIKPYITISKLLFTEELGNN